MSQAGSNTRPQVAIIGGGITGLALASGLHARNVRFTVYERAPAFRDIGAGIGISPNAERALFALSPDALAAFKRVAMPNAEDYFQWVDGYQSDEVIYRLYLGEGMFQGCRRADLVEELGKLVPPECVRFGKQCSGIVEEEDGAATINFSDGSTARADIVVGCDGIRSRVRPLILGEDNPASYAAYTKHFCFRSLVPMDRARAAIGEHRSSTRFMYNGPGCHVITYPVAQGTVLNVLAVITDPNAWPHGAQITARGSREEAEAAFVGWHPTVRAIVSLFPDDMEKWALFDMQESPAQSYARRGICVAGDAAHASGPHLGAGAAFGIEDAVALSSLLTAVDKEAQEGGGGDMSRLCCEALDVYDKVRQERTKWLVGATREACDLFHWRYPGCGSDPKKFGEEITLRLHKVWEYDLDEMARDALSQFATRCKGSSAS